MSKSRAHLYRFLNGRLVSFDVDMLLSTFAPYHQGVDTATGIVPLRFPEHPNRYEMRFASDALLARRTLLFRISLPIHAPAFWFCVYCVMRDDNVALISNIAPGIFFSRPDAPDHFSKEMLNPSIPRLYTLTVPDLLAVFTSDSADA